MRRVFVDSGGFFALFVPKDQFHRRSHSLFQRANKENWHLVTTNAVIFETHALLLNRTRNGPLAALRFLDIVFRNAFRIIRVRQSDERQAVELIRRHQDKAYSLCDALSFVVMQREDVLEAIAFDRHFRSFGHFTIL